MTILVTVLAVVLALVVVLVAGLLRSHAEILRALHEVGVDLDPERSTPGAGVTAPRPRMSDRAASDISGVTPDGDAASVAIVGARHPTLVAFLTSGCTSCIGFWEAFADTGRLAVPGGARLVAVTKGPDAESPARLRRFASPGVLVVMSSEAWEAYDVPVAPYFAYVDGPSGTIVGEGAASGWEHLVGMTERALADAGLPATSGRGVPRARGEPTRALGVFARSYPRPS